MIIWKSFTCLFFHSETYIRNLYFFHILFLIASLLRTNTLFFENRFILWAPLFSGISNFVGYSLPKSSFSEDGDTIQH